MEGTISRSAVLEEARGISVTVAAGHGRGEGNEFN